MKKKFIQSNNACVDIVTIHSNNMYFCIYTLAEDENKILISIYS